MPTRAAVWVLAAAVLAGCGGGNREQGSGGSGLNPFNWFRSGPEVETLVPLQIEQEIERRPLIAQVQSARAERLPGGVIIRATGIAREQGFWQADLVATDGGLPSGVLTLRFLAAPHPDVQPVGSARTRQITTGTFLSTQDLAGVRTIRVISASNAVSVRP